MKNKLIIVFILIAVLVGFLGIAQNINAAANNYVVLTDSSPSDRLLPGQTKTWYQVAQRIADYRHGTIIQFDPNSDLSAAENALRAADARYVAVVVRPENMTINFARKFLMMSTQIDSDPFVDFAYGYITGVTADAAMNFVNSIYNAEAGVNLSQPIGNMPLSAAGYMANGNFNLLFSPYGFVPSVLNPSSENLIYIQASDSPDYKNFFNENKHYLEHNKVIVISGNGDAHMSWGFADQDRHYLFQDNWPYDPNLVENPPVVRNGVTSDDIRSLNLYPAVAFTGTCHSGNMIDAIMDGDNTGTEGDPTCVPGTEGQGQCKCGDKYFQCTRSDQTTPIRLYEIKNPNWSFGLSMLQTGVTGWFAPMKANHGAMDLQDEYNAFLYNEPLGDVFRRSLDEIVMGFYANHPNLRLYTDGESATLNGTLPSGTYDPSMLNHTSEMYLSDRASRVYYGDPLYNPFANNHNPSLNHINYQITNLSSNSFQLNITVNKPANFDFPEDSLLDMFHNADGTFGETKYYITVDLPNGFDNVTVNPVPGSATGKYNRIITGVEHFQGSNILHVDIEADGDVSTQGTSANFQISLQVTITNGCTQDSDCQVGQVCKNSACVATPTQPSIDITSPKGGEIWTIGETHNIVWNSQDITKVIIYLQSLNSRGAQTDILLIGSFPASQGSYSWQIPNDLSTLMPHSKPGDNFKIIIFEVKPNGTLGIQKESDSYFTIKTPESITITSPNGGEQWLTGQTYNIVFKATGIDKVDIGLTDYSHASGSSGAITKTIVNDILASQGSYSWSIPQDLFSSTSNWKSGDNFKISVYEKKSDGTYGIEDESDAPFNIVAAPTPVPCPDRNGDGKIDILDLIAINKDLTNIRNNINKSPSEIPSCQRVGGTERCPDINGDGKINILDLIAIRSELENAKSHLNQTIDQIPECQTSPQGSKEILPQNNKKFTAKITDMLSNFWYNINQFLRKLFLKK